MSEPIRVSKRQRPTEEDKRTRQNYREEKNGRCELCGMPTGQIHHIFKQQKIYWEDPRNYALLDQWNCHRLIESHKKQFIRDISIHPDSNFYGMDKGEVYDMLRKHHRELDLGPCPIDR